MKNERVYITGKSKYAVGFVIFTLSITVVIFGALDFGEKFRPIQCPDIKGNTVSIPLNKCVSVLLFFNSHNETHIRVMSELDSVFFDSKEKLKNVRLVFVSKTETDSLTRFGTNLKFKNHVINDIDEKLFSFFNYKCGVCGKVIILDKEGIIRYHAEYIDNYFIQSIAERYDVEKNPAKKNTVVVNGGK